jgi:hypothetical protein
MFWSEFWGASILHDYDEQCTVHLRGVKISCSPVGFSVPASFSPGSGPLGTKLTLKSYQFCVNTDNHAFQATFKTLSSMSCPSCTAKRLPRHTRGPPPNDKNANG